jgi:hypothetical protein
MGPLDLSAGAATTKTITFTDTQNIAAGQMLNLALVADLSNSEDVGDTFLDGACAYQASFTAFASSDIRVVSTGEFLDITKIVPNSNVTGNALTVKSSGLTASLASNPVSGALVKKQQNVPVAGLVLTAAAQSDITITNLTLTGQAALAASGCAFGPGSCAVANFSQRVTSLAIFDGATQVGQAKSPDTVTGKAQIANMNLVIPKGTSKNLTVVASFSSTASTTSPFDKIAVGVATANDIQAQDQDANTVNPALDAAVTNQSSGAAPAVVQTILNSGNITVQADAHPSSNIVIAGKDAWVPFAQYKATAQYENITIDRIAVIASSTAGTTGDNADFAMVAIASGGAVKGSDTISAGATGTKDIDLSTNTINVPKDGSVQFQIWAKVSPIQASSTVSGATTGVSRSGHAPAAGLNSNIVTGEWDANYAGMLNIRSTGAASGERVYAATGAAHGNMQVLRKTVPIVTKQSLSSTTLADVDQDLVKFQVAADSAGSIAMKQVVFQFSKTAGVGLTNFRMRRGASDLDVNIYAVTDDTGVNLKTTPTAADTGYIVFAMKEGQEESISGSGNVYTLHATVSGASAGKSVTVSFYRDVTNPIVTGYLSNSNALTPLPSSADIYNIDTAVAASGAPSNLGTFLWSDNSEVPHASQNQTSRDWTNDVYVQDLSQQQTLRP